MLLKNAFEIIKKMGNSAYKGNFELLPDSFDSKYIHILII